MSFVLCLVVCLSLCLQIIFWLLHRPVHLIAHLVLLQTRRPATVKNAQKGVSYTRMPGSAFTVAADFTFRAECVWWSVRGACPVFLMSWCHVNMHHHNISVIAYCPLSLPPSQRVSSEWCMPTVCPTMCILPRKFLSLSELWESILAAGPLLQVTVSRGLLPHQDRVPSLSSSL